VTATAATRNKSVGDEAQEILSCLWQVLREPRFASALVRVLSGKRQGAEPQGAPAPVAVSAKGKG
jgi:hypothetical protein